MLISQSDEAGNVGQASLGLIKDTTAPIITLSAPAASFKTQGGIVITGTCESGTISISGDTTPMSVSCSSGSFSQSLTLSGTDGTKTITLTQVDSAGNSGSISRAFIKDTTAPDLNITSPVSSDRFQSSTLVAGTCEAGGSLDFTGANITPVTNVTCPGSGNFTQSLTLLGSDGSKSFTVEHKDSLNNLTSVNVTITKDNVAPTMTLASPASMTNSQLTLTLTGTCGAAQGDSGQLTLESASVSGAPLTVSCSSGSYSQQVTLAGIDGSKTITIKQSDSAGNETSVTRTFVKDTTAPILAISSPNSLSSYQTSLTITGTCESLLVIQITGDLTADTTATCSSGAFSKSIALSTGDGLKTIQLSQTDSAGNSTSVQRSFNKDTTAPILTFTAPAAGSSVQSVVNISGICEAGYTINYSGAISSPASTSCGSGTFSDSVTVSLGEGSKTLTVSQTDSAGNTGSTSVAIARDNTAPVLTFSTPSSLSPFQGSLTFTGTCGSASTDLPALTLSGPFGTSPLSLNCSAGAFSGSLTLTGSDGLKTLTISQSDQAGNVGSQSLSVYKDTTAPALTFSSPAARFVTQSSLTLSGACESGLSVVITGDLASTINATCSSSAFSQSVALTGADGSKSLTLTQTDAAGNSTSVTRNYVKDSVAPTVQSMSILAGATQTQSSFVTLAFSASDATSKLNQFCLKYNDSTAPVLAATCWKNFDAPSPNLTPAQSLSVTNFAYQIGVSSGVYNVYVWVRDEASNISSLGSAGAGTLNVDRYSITYAPNPPPVIINAMAFSSDAPSDPNTVAQKTMASGQTVYVKWNATSSGFGSSPITAAYTTDDVTYTAINSGTGYANGSNGGCVVDHASSTFDDGSTGCFTFSSPTSGYFRVRLTAIDTSSYSAVALSNPVNVASTIDLIAGNTESGLNGSAATAVYFLYMGGSATPDPQSMVIRRDGTIYFRDLNRGLLYVNPTDGILRKFISVTGTSTGDGGAPTSATLKQAMRIALDFDDNLLIYDYNRIRKVNFATNTITTIIGGGASIADNVAALSYSMSNINYQYFTIQATPSGNIHFPESPSSTPATTFKIRTYDKTSQTLSTTNISGTGLAGSATQDVSLCGIIGYAFEYDINTKLATDLLTSTQQPGTSTACTLSAQGHHDPSSGIAWKNRITASISYHMFNMGMDGKIYAVSRINGKITRFNSTTQLWENLVGTGVVGSCNDGTVATSCNIDPQDVFVTAQSRVYFVDKGRIRLIADNGTVQTVLGQSLSYGENIKATSARFNLISQIGYWTNGTVHKINLLDQQENKFREFTLGGNISTIAGNSLAGAANYTSLATAQPLSVPSSGTFFDEYVTSPTDGSIYANNTSFIAKLNRASGMWEKVVGGGATPYYSGDTMTGLQVSYSGYYPRPIGIYNNQLLSMVGRWNGTAHVDSFIKSYDMADSYRQTSLMGLVGAAAPDGPNWCATGTATTACPVPRANYPNIYNRMIYDSYQAGGRWILLPRGGQSVRSIASGTATVINTNALQSTAIAFTYIHTATVNALYYCALTDKKLHKYDFSTNTETTLSWPIAALQCSSNAKSMVYIPARNSLVFVYTQNNLDGIAEYFLP